MAEYELILLGSPSTSQVDALTSRMGEATSAFAVTHLDVDGAQCAQAAQMLVSLLAD